MDYYYWLVKFNWNTNILHQALYFIIGLSFIIPLEVAAGVSLFSAIFLCILENFYADLVEKLATFVSVMLPTFHLLTSSALIPHVIKINGLRSSESLAWNQTNE